MKTLIIVLSVLFVMSCATVPTTALPPQKIIVEVVSGTDSKVAVQPNQVNKSMEVHNPEGQLSNLTFISNGKAFIKIFSGLSVADVTRLWNDIVVLENNTSIKEVHVFINSPGGDAFSGLALSDTIEGAKKKGFYITAHASGIIASAAVPVFAVCNKRIASVGTIFMVHEAAVWKWPGRETASDIRTQNKMMGMLAERYRKYLTDNSKIDDATWEKMETATTWFTAKEAMDFGLVDEIE